ncbi:hypothetical protein PoB_000129400 [Plakobranchus ocellatus]|uniref:Uncharacterized protein n=1 Tax=Plakobranchus ocellatus TaxID=259542 RepID=A0AAV3XV96_9GAST|nr:hypothetical protein PoB_000129400 [Plakobranchus ocellatus]
MHNQGFNLNIINAQCEIDRDEELTCPICCQYFAQQRGYAYQQLGSRFVMEICLMLVQLGRVPNAALRLVLRAVRSTPIVILELAAGCEPLSLTRGEQTVLAQERYLRTGVDTPPGGRGIRH